MRTGKAQQSAKANPLVTVTVDSDVYKSEGGGGNERILRVYTDEQAWGGEYIVELDNDDGTLDAKDYEGEGLTLNFSFIGETTDDLPPLWVIYQEHISEEGKIRLILHCGDAWSLIAAHNVALVNASFNQEWQTTDGLAGRQMPDGSLITDAKWSSLYNELVARGSRNIWAIIGYLETATGVTITMTDTDSYITSLKPPISVANARAGLRQLMDYTESYLRLTAGGGLTVIQPSAHASVYTYDDLDVPFKDAESAEIVIPNRIRVWAFNEAGSAWHNGEAVDSDSYTKLGKYITRNYLVATLDNGNKKSEADLNDLAAGILSKLQGELSQGTLIAPMHCTQELFDKITVVDNRYATPKTIIGYVNRIIREYDRGVYRITLQLGGVTSGWTPPGGSDAPGLADSAPPVAPPDPGGVAIGAYIADVVFTSVDWNTASWDAGLVTLADGRSQSVDSSSFDMTEDGAWYFYVIFGNSIMQKSQTATDAVGEDRMLIAVASRGSTTAQKAYVLNPFTDSILINTDKVMDGLVTELKLANEAVTNAKIAVNAIQGAVIAAGAITETKIGSNAVSTPKIEAGAITTYKIAAYDIIASRIATNAITASKIKANAVTADKVNAGAITAIKIDAHAIDASKLAASIVLSTIIYAGGTTVKLDSSGIRIDGAKLTLRDSGGGHAGTIYIDTSGYLRIDPWVQIKAKSILPVSNKTYYLGLAGSYWKDVYAERLITEKITLGISSASFKSCDYFDLPVASSVPGTGTEGRMVVDTSASTLYRVKIYLNGAWRFCQMSTV